MPLVIHMLVPILICKNNYRLVKDLLLSGGVLSGSARREGAGYTGEA